MPLMSPASTPLQSRPDFSKYLNIIRSPRANYLFRLIRRPNGQLSSPAVPSHGHFKGDWSNSIIFSGQNGALSVSVGAKQDTMPTLVAQLYQTKVFFLTAQRYGLGRSSFGRADRLSPDASNLPQFLLTLQGERAGVFAKLVDHLREIFPTVHGLSVAPLSNNSELEVRIWPSHDMSTPELGFSLENCGTGIGQLIAILGVIMTINNSVIVIDELSSFVRPAAMKALLRIIRTHYPDNQLIVATHSTDVMVASDPSSTHLLRNNDFESTVTRIDSKDLEQLRQVAGELGISMTDVFASDSIVWVEGLTEELCFPYIYNELYGPLPRGLVFAPIIATGDFAARRTRRELVLQIYQRLSEAVYPLVRHVAFSFDRDTFSRNQMADLKRIASKAMCKISFLPRRNFECFLLDPKSLAEFFRVNCGDHSQTEFTVEQVGEVILRNGGLQEFGAAAEWKSDLSDEDWLSAVDGAKLLACVCQECTKAQLTFAKAKQSLELLKLVVKNDRSKLSTLGKHIQDLVNGAREWSSSGLS